jgi:hypothetical protein
MRHIIVCIGSIKVADYRQYSFSVLNLGGQPKIVRLPDGFLPISEDPTSYYGVDLAVLSERFDWAADDLDEVVLIRELFKRQYRRDFNESVVAVLVGPDVVCGNFNALKETLDSVFNYVVVLEPAQIIRIEG